MVGVFVKSGMDGRDGGGVVIVGVRLPPPGEVCAEVMHVERNARQATIRTILINAPGENRL